MLWPGRFILVESVAESVRAFLLERQNQHLGMSLYSNNGHFLQRKRKSASNSCNGE